MASFCGCSTEMLRNKLQERRYTEQWLENALQRCGNRCEKYNLILLPAMLLETKILRDFMIVRHVTPYNFACNLCRNIIARHVAAPLRMLVFLKLFKFSR